MLTKSQKKQIKKLHTKKGREQLGLCLVEGKKSIKTAGSTVKYTFSRDDTKDFDKLVTTETSQDLAGVARIPVWSLGHINQKPTIVMLDGVQDPGNVGSIIRLCLGFEASLILINSADITNPKVIRSSAGAMFQVPWMQVKKDKAPELITSLHRPIYRLEHKNGSKKISHKLANKLEDEIIIIAGSEGKGITMDIIGASLHIPHSSKLESLNVTHALAIFLHERQS